MRLFPSVVVPKVVLAIGAPIAVIVRVGEILLHIVNHLA